MIQKFIIYLKLMRFHRPVGIWLLLWPVLWALWIANQGTPDLKIFIIFTAGTIVMRAAGCVINDYADRKFDGFVTRTKDRPLASGQIQAKEAIILFIILCISAFILVMQLNSFTILLSLVALLLASIYPFTKRITHWPQFVLGLAFAWSVPMVFAAQTNHIANIAWWIFAVAVLWPLAYDTMYALVDSTDDQKIGIKSTAILFGRYNKFIIGFLQIVILGLLIFIGTQAYLKFSYYFSLFIVAGLFSYQQYLIKDYEPQKCFRAFLNNQWVGLTIFLGIITSF